jgi:putative colanic acid biosynthesis acetyltransferase WcaF
MKLEGYTVGAFDRGASRWKERLWVVVKCVLFLPRVPLPSSWRVALLRSFGARIGRGVVIRWGVNISYPWRLTIGDHVWLGEEVSILSLAPVTLESNVCVSQRAYLCTGSHAFRQADFALRTKPITIHAGSWVAAQAFIAPGVSVGPNSMICAGSVVFDDVPPDTTVRGNPAEPVVAVGGGGA